MGKIVLFMGKSSSGKDTIIRRLVKENKYNLKEIVMSTTRPPRTFEVNGREYYFCTEVDMRRLQDEHKIIEMRKYDTIYGPWYYFTTSMAIDLENNNYIASNTLSGLDQYLEYYSKDEIISILVEVDDGVRLTRALERERKEANPKYQELCRRFLADSEDFSIENIKKRSIDFTIYNNQSLEQTMQEVNKVLKLCL